MKKRTKILSSWLAVAFLSVGAFFTGMQLRDSQNVFIPQNSTIQTTALLKLTPEWSPVSVDSIESDETEDRNLVNYVLRLLKTHYVDPVTKETETSLSHGAARGMLDSLNDVDSRFLNPSQHKLVKDASNGKFHGIGAIMALREETKDELEITNLIVITPMPGSPAEKAGIQPGDIITHLDEKWIIAYDPFAEADIEGLARRVRNKEIDSVTFQKTYEAAFKKLQEGMTISDALETLSSQSSEEIKVSVKRRGQNEPLEMTMQCATVQVDPVETKNLNDGIAYIRIAQFSKQAAKEFSAEIGKIESSQTKAIILDLRNNPGGLMDAATEITSKFTGGGVMASVQTNSGKRTIRTARSDAMDISVAVLMNRGTSSVAELAAGALKDRINATLVGDNTFGDGMIQTPLILKDGSAAVLTTGKMFTPNGVDFDGTGLKPDRKVEKPDEQLNQAISILTAKIGKA